MTELLKLPELWKTLKNETRPIVLYGMGDGADKILDICKEKGIEIAGVFDSGKTTKTKMFHQWKVESMQTLEDRYPDFVVLLAFGSARENVLREIEELQKRHPFYIPSTPVAGTNVITMDFFENNFNDYQWGYSLFEDDLSRKTYWEILAYGLTGKMEYLQSHTVTREEMFKELFTFGEEEVFVDAGAYRGDTVDEFLHLTKGAYKNITALEPDGKNFLKLKENMGEQDNTTIYNAASWNKEEMLYFAPRSGRSGRVEQGTPNTRGIAIDSLVKDHWATYMKYDVEGAEGKALEGSRETIACSTPKLLVSAYHRPEDLFALAQQIQSYNRNYNFYLRRNPGVPAWDINLICLPKEETL